MAFGKDSTRYEPGITYEDYLTQFIAFLCQDNPK